MYILKYDAKIVGKLAPIFTKEEAISRIKEQVELGASQEKYQIFELVPRTLKTVTTLDIV